MMLSTLALIAALTQAPVQAAPLPTLEEARLQSCLMQVRLDSATAIAQASEWQGEVSGPGSAYPLQCLGIAYTRMGKWEAARDAFVEARDATPADVHDLRATLGAMAGNAALAINDNSTASSVLASAEEDATAAGDRVLAATIARDLSRALAALNRDDEAIEAIYRARTQDPQSAEGWQLSAAFARRAGDLDKAQLYIETAVALDPRDPDIGIEAGVIAAQSGAYEAARKSFDSVLALAPEGDHAVIARAYLSQLPDAP